MGNYCCKRNSVSEKKKKMFVLFEVTWKEGMFRIKYSVEIICRKNTGFSLYLFYIKIRIVIFFVGFFTYLAVLSVHCWDLSSWWKQFQTNFPAGDRQCWAWLWNRPTESAGCGSQIWKDGKRVFFVRRWIYSTQPFNA